MDMNGILISLAESDVTNFKSNQFETQSIPQKVFSSVWAVEAEVNNGGFSQYFFNESRATVGFVSEALETIQAAAAAAICRRAIAVAFPDGLPADLQAIRVIASEFPDEIDAQLNALDQEFYRYPDNLTRLLFAYVSRLPEVFGELPKPNDE